MRLPMLAALTVSLLLALAAQARADTYTVTGFGDAPGAECSGSSPAFSCPTLRAAAARATANDEVRLSAGTYKLGSPLEILADQDVTVFGVGARDTVLQPADGVSSRVLTVDSGASFTGIALRITGGNAADSGGNILNQGSLGLVEYRVDHGTAANGGGIDNAGSLELGYGLLDDNSGGGVLNRPGSTFLGIASTFAFNSVYALASSGDASAETNFLLWGATVGRNPNVGVELDNQVISRMIGSIVASNGGANCTVPISADGDGGGNVEDTDTCGLTDPSSKRNTDPLLAQALSDQGGQSDVLTIPAGSPAVNIVNNCFPIDQRLFARGQPCDAGAYEQSPALITAGPSGPTTSTAPSFQFDSAGVDGYECSLTGPGQTGAYAPCTSPKSYSGLAPGSYVFTVRTLDPQGQPTGQQETRTFTVLAAQPGPSPTPTPTPSPTPTPTPTPTPVPGQSVVVAPVKGKVLVKKPGSNTFVEVDATQGIPLGSTVDATHGTIQLTSQQTKNGQPQTAIFYDGQFKITQTKATTDLTLNQPLAPCGKRGRASAAAAKKKPKTRALWGSGHGSFRTVGQYSSATVRGTKWFVQDSCAGTLTRVAQGVVAVRDDVRHKTITLRAGKTYLARPRH